MFILDNIYIFILINFRLDWLRVDRYNESIEERYFRDTFV